MPVAAIDLQGLLIKLRPHVRPALLHKSSQHLDRPNLHNPRDRLIRPISLHVRHKYPFVVHDPKLVQAVDKPAQPHFFQSWQVMEK